VEKEMNQTFVSMQRSSSANELRIAVAVLFLFCGSVLAQNGAQPTNGGTPLGIRTTHLMGFETVSNNANGTLSFEGDALQFQKADKPAVQLKVSSVQDIFLGDQSKQVGGLPMTLGKAAVPFGGGRAISLFAHKKYDTLTLEYIDADGGIHGAIFQFRQGQAELLRNELVARGAHVSSRGNEPGKQSVAEVSSESK
jgi:hypothetical protein